MNYFILLCSSIAIAATPPPPTQYWGTPGVSYEVNGISVHLPLDVSYRLITEYFENGEILTQTGVSELDAIGARHGLIAISPASTYHAYQVYAGWKIGRPDSAPTGSTFFHLEFSGAIDIPAVVAEYEASTITSYAGPIGIKQWDSGAPIGQATTSPPATNTPAPTATGQPIHTTEPLTPPDGAHARRVPSRIVLAVCACMLIIAIAVTATAVIAVLAWRKYHVPTSTKNALHK